MKNILNNFLWKFGERISAQMVSLIVSIVLARLLSPEDYGSVAIIMVFITIANVLVSSGFSTALIQKKDADEVDFSSVFYFSILFSILLYIILFVAAPWISEWYGMPILKSTLRVLGIRIIIGGVNSVQHAYVSRKMMFKKFFFSTLGGTIISAILGIVLAYRGFGVWALIVQYLTNTIIDTVVLAFTVDWRPRCVFSAWRLKKLLTFGWKILASALIGAVYDDLRTLIIGKKYSNTDLAYYSKGQQFPQIIMNNVNTSITSVLFPVLAGLQDDKFRMQKASRLSVQLISAGGAPLMLGLAAVGEPIIRLLLTEKWLQCVPFLQICCIYYLVSLVYGAYLQTYKALGKSGLALSMELIDDFLGISLIILFFNNGVMAIALITLISRLIACIACLPINKKLLNVKIIDQLRDAGLPIANAIIMFIVIRLMDLFQINYIMLLVDKIFVGASVYVGLAVFFKMPALNYVKNYLKK